MNRHILNLKVAIDLNDEILDKITTKFPNIKFSRDVVPSFDERSENLEGFVYYFTISSEITEYKMLISSSVHWYAKFYILLNNNIIEQIKIPDVQNQDWSEVEKNIIKFLKKRSFTKF